MKRDAGLILPSVTRCLPVGRTHAQQVVASSPSANSEEPEPRFAASDYQLNRRSFVHTWANDAMAGRSEAGLMALLGASRASDSHELEFVVSGGFYAFWQLVVWAVYDARGRTILLDLASAWRKDGNSAMKEQLTRHLLRKAQSVAEITGENNLVEFCQQFLLIVTADQWTPVH